MARSYSRSPRNEPTARPCEVKRPDTLEIWKVEREERVELVDAWKQFPKCIVELPWETTFKAKQQTMTACSTVPYSHSDNRNTEMESAGTSVSVPADINVICKPLGWAGTCIDNQPPC